MAISTVSWSIFLLCITSINAVYFDNFAPTSFSQMQQVWAFEQAKYLFIDYMKQTYDSDNDGVFVLKGSEFTNVKIDWLGLHDDFIPDWNDLPIVGRGYYDKKCPPNGIYPDQLLGCTINQGQYNNLNELQYVISEQYMITSMNQYFYSPQMMDSDYDIMTQQSDDQLDPKGKRLGI